MTNAQSGYTDLFSSGFSENWSPFSQSGLDFEEFIVGVIIPTLLPFCVKEFIDLESAYGVLNLLGVRSMTDLATESAFHFLSLQCGLGSSILGFFYNLTVSLVYSTV